MTFPGRPLFTLAALSLLAAALSGCPFEFEKERRDNSPPFTFFDSAPSDTTFSNAVFFRWLGTDLDNDVVAFQYQLVETDSDYFNNAGQDSLPGEVLRSLDPVNFTGEQEWTERITINSRGFSDLQDGWYEMRARSIDETGAPSPPAVLRFYVFFDDVPPLPVISGPPPPSARPACGRIDQATSWNFWFDASDSSRSAETPRLRLQYQYKLRALTASGCDSHLTDGFTPWVFFPDDTLSVNVGNAPPTLYSDLFNTNCGWEFTVRVRDPAGNTGSAVCCIARESGC